MNVFIKEYAGLILGILSVVLSVGILVEIIPFISRVAEIEIYGIFG